MHYSSSKLNQNIFFGLFREWGEEVSGPNATIEDFLLAIQKKAKEEKKR